MARILDILLLFPYYAALSLRHILYNRGVWKSRSYPVPVISVGNITVGGTGKTPHTELLLRILGGQYHNLAVVSRGYGRKTKGHCEVRLQHTAREVGDESLQIKKKFPQVRVVVDADRQRAIESLMALPPEQRPEVILLDDAFQHRAVRPRLSIVLVNYHRPIDRDHLLPIGRLRDLPGQIRRADWVIVTKCPGPEVDELQRQQWRKRLGMSDQQRLFFSKITYAKPLPVLEQGDSRYVYAKQALLFSGIADDRLLMAQVRSSYQLVGHRRFGDHHRFTRGEWKSLAQWAAKYPTAVVLTTEKDARRIDPTDVPNVLRDRLFYVPIEAEIIPCVGHLSRVIPEDMRPLGDAELLGALQSVM